jgi:hypothetical protein
VAAEASAAAEAAVAAEAAAAEATVAVAGFEPDPFWRVYVHRIRSTTF